VSELESLLHRVHEVFEKAGVAYRLVGGFAIYLHVTNTDRSAGRTTRDIDVAVRRSDLQAIIDAARKLGFEYRHAAGVDLLMDATERDARRGVHFVFAGEKVRPDYVEPVPFGDAVTFQGALVATIADLVHMKLTSFRIKDQVHIKDLDELGLITPDIEATLSPFLRDRLAHVRATE
jgi:hypothetical protein